MTEAEKIRLLVSRRMVKASDALRGARILFDGGLYDDTTSRAYYAMFHAASALLLTKGLSSSKHKGVLSLFDLHFVKPGIAPTEMSAWIHGAFRARQLADYSDEALDPRPDAERTLTQAGNFVAMARQILAEQSDEPSGQPSPGS